MSNEFWMSLFTFLTTIFVATIQVISVIKLNENHKAMNSRLSQLLEVATSHARSEGKAAGIKEEQQRTK